MVKSLRTAYKLAAILLIPVEILLAHISSFNAAAVETLYSKSIYPVIGQSLSLITGIFPFSLAEFIVIILPLCMIAYVTYSFIKIFRHPSIMLKTVLELTLNILTLAAVIFILFLASWGFNYYRQPFAVLAGLDVRPASVEELEEVCSALIEKANALRAVVKEDSQGVMDIEESSRAILKRCIRGYENAARVYPELGGQYGTPKPVLLSPVMNYTAISGVYFPFTGEANVNVSIPDSMLPCTACHEMAHQRGFAREDEANYISYLVCTLHPDADFQYSGTLLAVINAMNALYRSSPERYFTLREKYSEAVMRDLAALDAFWKRYEGPIEETSERINNAYLKANKQKDGVQSYGRMVDLLIAEYRKNKEA